MEMNEQEKDQIILQLSEELKIWKQNYFNLMNQYVQLTAKVELNNRESEKEEEDGSSS